MVIVNWLTAHCFDSNQRLVDLDVLSRDRGVVKAVVSQESQCRAPRLVHAVLVDNNGVPSVAAWIQLT